MRGHYSSLWQQHHLAIRAIVPGAQAALQRDVRRSLGALRDRRAAVFMAGGAFFGPFMGVTLSLAALQFIEAGVAAAITSVYPVVTLAISSRFHGERFTLRNLLGALVAAAGVVVLFLR